MLFFQSPRHVILTLVLLGLAGVSGYLVSGLRFAHVTDGIREDVAFQLATLTALSDIMARGGVDEVTEKVIRDCPGPERQQFDELLGRLSPEMSRGELETVSRLFDRCAAFYSRQKAVMVARFEREVQYFSQLIERYEQLVIVRDERYNVLPWQELAQYEMRQSELFDQLVVLQGDIIAALLAGDLDTTTALRTQVAEVQEMQQYNAVQMRALRESLPVALSL
jgi:hypothetical protein